MCGFSWNPLDFIHKALWPQVTVYKMSGHMETATSGLGIALPCKDSPIGGNKVQGAEESKMEDVLERMVDGLSIGSDAGCVSDLAWSDLAAIRGRQVLGILLRLRLFGGSELSLMLFLERTRRFTGGSIKPNRWRVGVIVGCAGSRLFIQHRWVRYEVGRIFLNGQ